MRTTDIQIWYKQAYWSQTNYIYKHGFFYNTHQMRDISDFFFLKKKKGTFGFLYIYTFLFICYFCDDFLNL